MSAGNGKIQVGLIDRLQRNVTPMGEVPPPPEPAPPPLINPAVWENLRQLHKYLGELKGEIGWIEDIHNNRLAREEEIAALDQEIETKRTIIASLRHEQEDIALETQGLIDQRKAAQDELARWRAKAEQEANRKGGW
jgi:hypothetical protein